LEFADTILVEHAIANREGELVQGGAFCAETGVHTGRSLKDKFVVADVQTENPSGGKEWPALKSIFSFCSTISLRTPKARPLCARPLAAPIRNTASRSASITSWRGTRCSSARCSFARIAPSSHTTSRTSPFCRCRPSKPIPMPRRAQRTIAIDFTRRIILIGGTSYAGEMKKSVFTTLNYYLPAEA
jgi:phosphoenolpyruvate carboxykinase (ATP)